MVNLLYCLTIILSGLLAILSFVFGEGISSNFIINIIGSILIIGLSIAGMVKKTKSLNNIILILGMCLAIWPVISLLIGNIGISLAIWGIVLGLLITSFALIGTQIIRAPYISAIDRSGDELTTVSNIKCKGDNLVVKAVLLGSMPSTIIMKPEELWKMIGLMESNVFSNLIRLLFIGWKRTRKSTDKNGA